MAAVIPPKTNLKNGGSLIGSEKYLNLIQGANITLTTTDNTGTGALDVTIAASASSGMTNPMTTLGDIIYGGASGAPTRLAGNTTTTPQFYTSTGSTGVATAPILTASTGSGNVVLATSPTLVTPVLGAATATSINKITLTQPATGSTLTILDGKTATINNTLTLAGTDSTTMTFPTTSATIARTDASNSFTGNQTITGNADAVQLLVKGNSTQTSNVLEIQNSTGTKLFTLTNAGSPTFQASASVTLTVKGTGGGNAGVTIDRSSSSQFGATTYSTNGVSKWSTGFYNDGANNDFQISDSSSNFLFRGAAGGSINFLNKNKPAEKFVIGSGGNVSMEMATPASPAAALAAGGTLTVATPYFYTITALDGLGETIGSAEVTATPTTGNQTVNLTWTAVLGASSYKVYRSTTTGVYTTPALLSNPTTNSYSDTGTAVSSGALPSQVTAYINKIGFAGNSWINSANLGIGTNAPVRLLHVKGDQSGGIATLERTNSSTNAVIGTVVIKGTSTGTAADGFGTGFQFAIQDTVQTAENLVGSIRAYRNGAINTAILDITVANAGTVFKVLELQSSASNTNYVNITGGATTVAPIVQATGTDSNIDLQLKGKGTGKMRIDAKYSNINVVADAATDTFDCSVSNWHRTTLGGNRILVLSNTTSGQAIMIELIQDATAGRVPVWPHFSSTFTASAVSANVITISKNIPTGTPITFDTTGGGTLPTGIVAGTVYYTINVSSTTISIATSLANAQAGTVATVTAGSGTCTIYTEIRWTAQTAPTLSGKYMKDRIGFTVDDATNGIVGGCVVMANY